MFMFRKKDVIKSTTDGLYKEALGFQNAVAEINKNISNDEITINVIESYAEKNNIDVQVLRGAFETFLKENALKKVRKVKREKDYTILDLEQAVNEYGYEMDDLNITFFSDD